MTDDQVDVPNLRAQLANAEHDRREAIEHLQAAIEERDGALLEANVRRREAQTLAAEVLAAKERALRAEVAMVQLVACRILRRRPEA
jgi:hypothetical protein